MKTCLVKERSSRRRRRAKVLREFRFISFSFWGHVLGGRWRLGRGGLRFGGACFGEGEGVAFTGSAVASLVNSGPAREICNRTENDAHQHQALQRTAIALSAAKANKIYHP